MSQTVRQEVTSKSQEWGYQLGSVYIRKVHFRDVGMIKQIEEKVVNRLRQVTSAIKQAGANQVSVITSSAEREAAVEFAKQLKKIPVIVKGTPGFLVNRLLMPYLNQAGVLLGEGVGIESIDEAMLEFGMPMGPLRLIDEVGIDVAYDVAHELAEAFKGRMTVAPILRLVHEQGLKGRKGGAGFYIYRKGKHERVNRRVVKALRQGARPSRVDPRPLEEIQKRLLGVMIQEAKLCLSEGIVAAEDDIDVGMIFGTGFPPFRGGLVKYARDAGLW